MTSSLELIDPRVAEHERVSKVLHGQHELQIYANDFFIDHLHASARSQNGSSRDFSIIQDRLDRLVILHNEIQVLKTNQTPNEYSVSPTADTAPWDLFSVSDNSRHLFTKLSEYRRESCLKQGHMAKMDRTFDHLGQPR